MSPWNIDVACTIRKGSMIDYALVTKYFVAAVAGVEAVKAVPWGPIRAEVFIGKHITAVIWAGTHPPTKITLVMILNKNFSSYHCRKNRLV